MTDYGRGELYVEFAPTNDYKARLANSIVIPGNLLLYGFTVSSTNAAAQYFMVFDASSVPGSGAIPCYTLLCAINGDRQASYLPPREFNTGICICNSTTNTSLTIGAADSLFDVQFQTVN